MKRKDIIFEILFLTFVYVLYIEPFHGLKNCRCCSQAEILPYLEYHEIVRQLSYTEFPIERPVLSGFILTPKAKITDILSEYASYGREPLMSERLKKMIENEFLTSPCQFYPVQFAKKMQIYDYYFMHLLDVAEPLIDFQASQFCVRKFSDKIRDIEVSSLQDLKKKQREVFEEDVAYMIRPERLCFTQNFNYDLFKIPFGIGMYISERLKERLVDQDITGIKIDPLKFEMLVNQ